MPTFAENCIDINILKQDLAYDPEKGLFFWIKRKQARKIGWFAGSAAKEGYMQLYIQGKHLMAHRVAWAIYYGNFPCNLIDHVNRNTSDNRIANLREATRSQNGQNTRKRSNNKSGFKGVCAVQGSKKWRVQMNVNKKRIDLGYFDTPELANEAYQKYCEVMHTHKIMENPNK